MKSEELLEKTTIPFLESDSELGLMENYESGDEANLKDMQNEANDKMEESDNRADVEKNPQETVSAKIIEKEEPGQVVYISDMDPDRCTENDLIHLAELFGKITNILLIKAKGEGYVEMSHSAEADAMVKFYQTKPSVIKGNVIRVELCQKYKRLNLTIIEKEEPGQVVYISDMDPDRCTENDLIHLAELFGKITNILLIKAKGEGYVELSHSEEAQAMVKFYQTKPSVIKGNVIKVEMSQKYKRLTMKLAEWEPTADMKPPFAVSQHRKLGVPQNTSAPEEDILAPTSTPNLAELRAKYSAQLLRWAKVPLEGNIPFKSRKGQKTWVPQTYEGYELDCFRFLPYAFKAPMLESHEQYLRSITGTPDMYDLDTPKIDDAFIQLLVGKKLISSREDLDDQLGAPERVLRKAQSKVAEIVGPLIVAIQKYELDELSGELDSLTTEQLKERLQSTAISCHQSIVCAGQTHRWLTNLRSENFLQLVKIPSNPQEHPNMKSSDLLSAEVVEQLQKRHKAIKRTTVIPAVDIKPIERKKLPKWKLAYYRNPNSFRGRGRSYRRKPKGPLFKSIP
uniref:uncharacterized protein n=1 Tax=Pristiophorus japonicus TaxID=55135 RepID=UPI00398EACE3